MKGTKELWMPRIGNWVVPLGQPQGVAHFQDGLINLIEGLRIVNFLLTNLNKHSQRIHIVKNIFLTNDKSF